ADAAAMASAAEHVAEVEVDPPAAAAAGETAETTAVLGCARGLLVEARAHAHLAELVVELPPLVVAQHLVGGGDLLEALLVGGARIPVGVKLLGELTVSLLDLLLRGRPRDSENRIQILHLAGTT